MEKISSTFGFMRGNVLVLIICRILYDTSLSMPWPFFSYYIRALGGSDIEVGLIFAIGGLGGLLLFPVGGFIADHRGRVKLVAIIGFILAITHIFFIIAQEWVILAIGLLIQELFMFYLPALSAIMADSLPPSRRGIGFATVTAIPQVLSFSATIVAGYIIDNVFGLETAMRVFFAVALVVGFVVATIRLKFLKETLKKSDFTIPLRNIPLLLKASYRNLFESFKWMSPTLWSIGIISILISLFANVAGPFWFLFATDVIGLTATEWGLLVFLDGALRIILSIPLGHLVDLYGTRRTILLSMILAPIPVMLFPFSRNLFQALPSVVILAIVNSLIWPASATLIANAVPRERRGRLLSILGAGLHLGFGGGMYTAGFLLYAPRILGSLIGGYVYEANPQYPWFIFAVSIIFCVLISIRFIHDDGNKED